MHLRDHLLVGSVAILLFLGYVAYERGSLHFFVGDGTVGVGVSSDAKEPRYFFKPRLMIEKGVVRLLGDTNLPEGTVYRIALDRELKFVGPRKSGFEPSAMIPELGAFVPDAEVTVKEPFKEYGLQYSWNLLSRVNGGGGIAGEIQFYPEAVQLFGCAAPACVPEDRIRLRLRVDHVAEQPAGLEWESADAPLDLETTVIFPLAQHKLGRHLEQVDATPSFRPLPARR